MGAQGLHISHQVLGGVELETGVGGRTTSAALIEQDDAIDIRVEEAAMIGLATGTGAAMHKQGRHPIGIATLLHIQGMGGINRKLVGGVGFNFRKQLAHGLLARARA